MLMQILAAAGGTLLVGLYASTLLHFFNALWPDNPEFNEPKMGWSVGCLLGALVELIMVFAAKVTAWHAITIVPAATIGGLVVFILFIVGLITFLEFAADGSSQWPSR